MLEGQIEEIKGDNDRLKNKLEGTNTSIGSFITEMNSYLDSHELTASLNMEVDSEEDDFESRYPADYEEIRPHAGTGGSSKLKSRPNQQQLQ